MGWVRRRSRTADEKAMVYMATQPAPPASLQSHAHTGPPPLLPSREPLTAPGMLQLKGHIYSHASLLSKELRQMVNAWKAEIGHW